MNSPIYHHTLDRNRERETLGDRPALEKALAAARARQVPLVVASMRSSIYIRLASEYDLANSSCSSNQPKIVERAGIFESSQIFRVLTHRLCKTHAVPPKTMRRARQSSRVARAQACPSRPVRLIVPLAPGHAVPVRAVQLYIRIFFLRHLGMNTR